MIVPVTSHPAMRGEVLIRVRSSVDASHVPSQRDVMDGRRVPMQRIDDGPADAAVRRHSRGMRVSRIHHAARSLGDPGHRHEGWDALESALGLPRLLRIEVHPEVPLVGLIEDLRGCGETVEAVSANWVCCTPFAASAARAASAISAQDLRPFTQIRHAEALAQEVGDPTLIVGIVDSGVVLGHAEFRDRLRPGVDLVQVRDGAPDGVRLLGDWRDRDRRPDDENGHGTACAGIIGARGLGVPPGLAGRSQILPVRVLAAALEVPGDQPTALGSLADIDAGFKAAIDLGARVLNLSFGTPASALASGDPVPHIDMVRYALARDCLLIAASGNSGDDERYYPACLPGVIAVGAVDHHDHPAAFSTRGDHVALCAPGVDILTVGLDGYRHMSGTSFAAPFVAATCALMMSRAAAQSSWLSPAAVRQALSASTRHFPQATAGCGSGILDVPAALAAVDDVLCDPTTEADDASLLTG
jgi:subtilisin family serine protease